MNLQFRIPDTKVPDVVAWIASRVDREPEGELVLTDQQFIEKWMREWMRDGVFGYRRRQAEQTVEPDDILETTPKRL